MISLFPNSFSRQLEDQILTANLPCAGRLPNISYRFTRPVIGGTLWHRGPSHTAVTVSQLHFIHDTALVYMYICRFVHVHLLIVTIPHRWLI